MSQVLYIKANAKNDAASRTFRISERFISEYKSRHPGDTVVTLDLYAENIHFLTESDIYAVFGEKTPESRNHPILKYAYQFAEADKYVVAEPLWNLSIPAILKAYIDYVSVSGVTFKYTAEGAVGLLQGKKAINISARGGDYSNPPMSDFEMGDRYLRTIFSFFGIYDFTTVSAEKLDIAGEDVEVIVSGAINKALELAGTF